MERIKEIVVKMKHFIFMLVFLYSIGNMVMCRPHSDVHTYYCKDIDYTFMILEKDTCDVLVFGNGDSVFYAPPLYGDYLGIEFFLSIDSNTIYLGPYFPTVYRHVVKNYKIKSLKMDIRINKDYYEPYHNNDKYWEFYGGCDQGSYTFGVWHDSFSMGSLEPLEWN